MRTVTALGFALLVAGCGKPATVEVSGNGVAVVTGDTKVSVSTPDCARAAHAPLYADAKITTCVASKDGDKRGTIIYTSGATPAAVLAWYKAEAEKAGLKVNLQTDMNLSASQGSKTLMVMAMMQGSENQVSVNWGE